jgi:hypothetical protein
MYVILTMLTSLAWKCKIGLFVSLQVWQLWFILNNWVYFNWYKNIKIIHIKRAHMMLDTCVHFIMFKSAKYIYIFKHIISLWWKHSKCFLPFWNVQYITVIHSHLLKNFLFYLLFYHFCISLHMHTLFGSSPPPLRAEYVLPSCSPIL